jgi:hypothetical protein
MDLDCWQRTFYRHMWKPRAVIINSKRGSSQLHHPPQSDKQATLSLKHALLNVRKAGKRREKRNKNLIKRENKITAKQAGKRTKK